MGAKINQHNFKGFEKENLSTIAKLSRHKEMKEHILKRSQEIKGKVQNVFDFMKTNRRMLHRASAPSALSASRRVDGVSRTRSEIQTQVLIEDEANTSVKTVDWTVGQQHSVVVSEETNPGDIELKEFKLKPHETSDGSLLNEAL